MIIIPNYPLMKRIIMHLIFYSCTVSMSGSDVDLVQLTNQLQELSPGEFTSRFPYVAYLNHIELDDIKQIEVYRTYLNDYGIDGSQFVQHLYRTAMDIDSVDFNHINVLRKYVNLGEVLAHSRKYLPDSILLYEVISDIIFNRICDTLAQGVANGAIDVKNFEFQYIRERLGDNSYFINLPTTKWIKLYINVRDGNWKYIWHKSMTTYLKEFLLFLIFFFVILSLFAGWLFRFIRKRHMISN